MNSIAMREKAEGGKNQLYYQHQRKQILNSQYHCKPYFTTAFKRTITRRQSLPETIPVVIQGEACRERLDRLCWLTEVSALLSILT